MPFYYNCIDISNNLCIIIISTIFVKTIFDNGDFQMYRKNNDSKKIKIAAFSLFAVALLLVIFTVKVYNNKRLTDDGRKRPVPMNVYSNYDAVTDSDISSDLQEVLSSEETVVSDESSENDSVSSVPTAANDSVSSVPTAANYENDILNPDNKSDFYMVVYTGNQMIVVYQKDENGKYTHKFHFLKCSTGATDTTPTAEGVYRIEKKVRWGELRKNDFAQYCCLISEEKNYYISSISYSKKSAWTMKSGVYDNIGKASTDGNIQLCVRDAYWIYNNMPTGTQVNVVNREGPDIKIKALPKSVKKNAGWDPTDKWSKGNPYYETPTSATTTTTTAPPTTDDQTPDEEAIG